MKTFDFKHHGHLPILFKNAPHSKVLEPVCLFPSYLLSIVTQSLSKGGWGGFESYFQRNFYVSLGFHVFNPFGRVKPRL